VASAELTAGVGVGDEMPELIKRIGRVEIVSPMPAGMRVALALAGLLPFLAPYQLLFSVEWTGFLNPFFAFALTVSIGAVAVGLLFLYASIAGISTVQVFDADRRTFTCTAVSLLRVPRTWTYAFDAVREVAVRTHAWSDGEDTYSLEVHTTDGHAFETGTATTRQEVEEWSASVRKVLGRP
jgi:hypothetical protein